MDQNYGKAGLTYGQFAGHTNALGGITSSSIRQQRKTH